MKRRDDPNQTLIDWSNPQAPAFAPKATFLDPIKLVSAVPSPLVQRLPWDFKTTFPRPTDEAIAAGVMEESDREFDNLQSLHENYSRQWQVGVRLLDERADRVDVGLGCRTAPKIKMDRAVPISTRLKTYLDK